MTMMMNMGLGMVGYTLMISIETRFMIISKCLMFLAYIPTCRITLKTRLTKPEHRRHCQDLVNTKEFTLSTTPRLSSEPL